MKIKEGFVLAEVGDDTVAVPVGPEAKTFHGIVRLNGTGAFIWRRLEEGLTVADITERMMAEYDVDEATASRAVKEIVDKLASDGFLEE